ncbi:hypothetical protein HK096_003835 [Nowakowskiella sp. JEL0078]|nr:hypothetical protein HK096_003835 [Nowakowskiella sp. JEL0078]
MLSEKFEIVSQFIKDSPPGEVNDVFNDVRVLLNDDGNLLETEEAQQTFTTAFEEYNTAQLISVPIPGADHEHGQLDDGRYLDPRTSQAFHFDHLNSQIISDLERVEPNAETENYRQVLASLDLAAQKYIAEHYPDGVSSVFDLFNNTFVIAIVDNKYNPGNFWNGRWRSIWTVTVGSVEIKGSIKLQIHYYEDGNVQLNFAKDLSAKLISTFVSFQDPIAFSNAVFKAITKQENDLQIALHEAYGELAGTTFKNLRRQLPITKSKIDWNFVSGYKIGAELASGSK